MSDHKNKLKAILREIEPDSPVNIGPPTQFAKTTIIHGDRNQAGGDVFVDRCHTVVVNKTETLHPKKQKSVGSSRLPSPAGLFFLIVLSLSLVQTPTPHSDPQIPIQPLITIPDMSELKTADLIETDRPTIGLTSQPGLHVFCDRSFIRVPESIDPQATQKPLGV